MRWRRHDTGRSVAILAMITACVVIAGGGPTGLMLGGRVGVGGSRGRGTFAAPMSRSLSF
jgi:hypothetical protein